MDRRGFLGLLGMAGAYAAVPKTLRRLAPPTPKYDQTFYTNCTQSVPLTDAAIFCVGDVVQLAYGPTLRIVAIHGNDVEAVNL